MIVAAPDPVSSCDHPFPSYMRHLDRPFRLHCHECIFFVVAIDKSPCLRVLKDEMAVVDIGYDVPYFYHAQSTNIAATLPPILVPA